MLKAPEHQVAGHQAHEGKLGPLVDGSGRFYKPLQNDGRGTQEVAFYTSFSSNPRIPDHIRQYFPIFYGTQLLEGSDGSGLHPHLVMQDLLSNLHNPSVVDIKIGSRTWYPGAIENYVQKCLKKDRETSGLQLGFRISGVKVYAMKELGYWKPSKEQVKSFTADDVRMVLRKYVSSNPCSDSDPDSKFASLVYGGSKGILAQLLELKAWFEDQTIFHFYSSSILMMYEKDAVETGKSRAQIKLVDFAHVVEGNGVIDHNFLGGLCSFIKFISEILTGPDVHTIGGFLHRSEESHSCFENGPKE